MAWGDAVLLSKMVLAERSLVEVLARGVQCYKINLGIKVHKDNRGSNHMNNNKDSHRETYRDTYMDTHMDTHKDSHNKDCRHTDHDFYAWVKPTITFHS